MAVLLLFAFFLSDQKCVKTILFLFNMKLSVNNKEMETQAATLEQLCEELKLPPKGIAVAVNNHMIPRTEWNSYTLKEGAQIVIIKAACGG